MFQYMFKFQYLNFLSIENQKYNKKSLPESFFLKSLCVFLKFQFCNIPEKK